MAITLKEAAELKRAKGELEQKRLTLKEKVKNHRDMGAEDLGKVTDQLRSLAEEIDDINEQLVDAPEPNTRGILPNVKTTDITEENFRSSAKYRDAFYRSYLHNKVSEADSEIMAFGKRAITDMNGGSVASGAEFLVPQTTLDRVYAVIKQYGRLYSAITKFGFTGDVSLPIGTTGAPTDNGDGTATLNFTVTEVAITQSAVVATLVVKNLLLRNSIPAFEQYLALEIGKYIGLLLENYVLNGGVDTSSFLGIITAIKSGTSAAKTYSDMDWGQISAILGEVESPYGDQGTWVMKRKTFFNRFFSLTDSAGKPLTTISAVVGGGHDMGINPTLGQTNYLIAGHPVLFTSQMPDVESVLFGDLSTYIVNESEAFTIESNTSEKFSEDKTVWRGKVYSGGKPLFAKDTFTYWSYVEA